VKSILLQFGKELGYAGMPETYLLMMDCEYQGKKEELHKLKYIVFKIYILSIRFHKIFVSVNTNSGSN
jgi:hypothetical protein